MQRYQELHFRVIDQSNELVERRLHFLELLDVGSLLIDVELSEQRVDQFASVVNKPVDEHERALVESVLNLQRHEDDSVAKHLACRELFDIDQENEYQDQVGAD